MLKYSLEEGYNSLQASVLVITLVTNVDGHINYINCTKESGPSQLGDL